ncbi:helix-turn-helix domain-containing protein [Enterococcus avium]|uniref:helix-turn-helix domain-containing protein n=1 Tax=Enterococcus avium TaxID=33945 RepID=UPI00066080BB
MNAAEKSEIGKRIKAIRTKHGMTLEKFGEIFEPTASKSIVSRWESGKSVPSNDRIKRISETFGVSTMYLLFGKKTSYDYPDDYYLNLLSDFSPNEPEIRSIQKNTNLEEIKTFMSLEKLSNLDEQSLDALGGVVDLIKSKDSKYKKRFLHCLWAISVELNSLSNNEDKNHDYKKSMFDLVMTLNYLLINYLELSNYQFAELNNIIDINKVVFNSSDELTRDQENLLKQLLKNLPMGDISSAL